ncbi:amidase family protein [Streptomyces sp. NPDC001100]
MSSLPASDAARLAAIDKHFHFGLSAEESEEFAPAVAGSLAMARGLLPEVRAAYDAALDRYDVLVMRTVPYTAKEIPPADISLADYLHLALSMVGNTAPFDATGHPSCSVPTDLVDGLPAGLMITGRPFGDTTVLSVAHTCERAVGGFPAP